MPLHGVLKVCWGGGGGGCAQIVWVGVSVGVTMGVGVGVLKVCGHECAQGVWA
jgi:hypothetical protein